MPRQINRVTTVSNGTCDYGIQCVTADGEAPQIASLKGFKDNNVEQENG